MMVLLPPEGLIEVSKVLGYGSKKYGRDNWRGGLDYTRLLSASMRHINEFVAGRDVDSESGLNHLAHAACNLLMLIEYYNLGLGTDDRWKNDSDK